jgi:uncharacterized protein (DUF924 family)
MTETVNTILDFWFGELDELGFCAPSQHSLWFKASEVTDEQCRGQFGECVAQALTGELDHWADTDRGLIALMVLLDQFTRNIHRGTAQAFVGDARALTLAQRTIVAGHHLRLPAIHQVFLYLPLEHSEDLEVQEEGVALFDELVRVTGNQMFADFRQYAVAHRDVIAQFGRFPHRNSILARESTAAELDYLATHGGF